MWRLWNDRADVVPHECQGLQCFSATPQLRLHGHQLAKPHPSVWTTSWHTRSSMSAMSECWHTTWNSVYELVNSPADRISQPSWENSCVRVINDLLLCIECFSLVVSVTVKYIYIYISNTKIICYILLVARNRLVSTVVDIVLLN